MFVDCKERRCGRHVNGVRSDPRTIRPFSHRPLNLVKTSPGASGFETRGTRPDGGNHDVNSSLDGACRTVVRRSRPGQPTRWPWQPSTPLRESGTTWSSARPWTISFRSSMKTGCLTDRGSAHETGRPRYGNPRVIDPSSIAAGRPGMPAVGQTLLVAGARVIVPGDAILAAQTILAADAGDVASITKKNARHLSRFPGIDAWHWSSITY